MDVWYGRGGVDDAQYDCFVDVRNRGGVYPDQKADCGIGAL